MEEGEERKKGKREGKREEKEKKDKREEKRKVLRGKPAKKKMDEFDDWIGPRIAFSFLFQIGR